MSAVDATTSVGEELTAETVREAVLREILEAGEVGFPANKDRRRSYTLGWLSQKVADFLNAHPEHRAELLPEIDPDSAVNW